jgi:hypothetical protein
VTKQPVSARQRRRTNGDWHNHNESLAQARECGAFCPCPIPVDFSGAFRHHNHVFFFLYSRCSQFNTCSFVLSNCRPGHIETAGSRTKTTNADFRRPDARDITNRDAKNIPNNSNFLAKEASPIRNSNCKNKIEMHHGATIVFVDRFRLNKSDDVAFGDEGESSILVGLDLQTFSIGSPHELNCIYQPRK